MEEIINNSPIKEEPNSVIDDEMESVRFLWIICNAVVAIYIIVLIGIVYCYRNCGKKKIVSVLYYQKYSN